MRDLMEKKVEASLLSGFYGALLTPNQAQMLRLYCDEDYSLTEIAGQYAVSRQSVYDTLSRAMQLMAQTEEKLHLAARSSRRLNELRELEKALCAPEQDETARAAARAIVRRLLSEEENNGV